MQRVQTTQKLKISKGLIKDVADSLANEMAERMYYKLIMLRFLPEINLIEKGKLRALRGKEIDAFLLDLAKS